jgi:hypothetical protein
MDAMVGDFSDTSNASISIRTRLPNRSLLIFVKPGRTLRSLVQSPTTEILKSNSASSERRRQSGIPLEYLTYTSPASGDADIECL